MLLIRNIFRNSSPIRDNFKDILLNSILKTNRRNSFKCMSNVLSRDINPYSGYCFDNIATIRRLHINSLSHCLHKERSPDDLQSRDDTKKIDDELVKEESVEKESLDEESSDAFLYLAEQNDYEEYVELDVHEEVEDEKPLSIDLTRGKGGVFDIDEIVSLVREQNASQIFVAKVPKEVQYVDYMVIVTGKSTRHITAMANLVRWVYKKKRGKKDAPSVKIEGQQTVDWMALDLGNIALHLFLHNTRRQYDLETLWTVGPEFDEIDHQKEDIFDVYFKDSFQDYADKG